MVLNARILANWRQVLELYVMSVKSVSPMRLTVHKQVRLDSRRLLSPCSPTNQQRIIAQVSQQVQSRHSRPNLKRLITVF